jgi:hypothetical protein
MPTISVEDFRKAESRIRALPGGASMCDRILAALQGDPGQMATRKLWLRLAWDLFYCSFFPGDVFQALHSQGDFDVRWPLSFACCYVLDSGASVDILCADFLHNAGLWAQARAVLHEYTGQEGVSGWRERFEQLA